jgi:hypothetical protein
MPGFSLQKRRQNAETPPEAGFSSGLQAALVHNGLYLFSYTLRGATWFEVPDRFLFTYRTAS